MGKRRRIGYGALDWADTRNSKIWLQNEFLKTIEKLEPVKEKKPLDDLAKYTFEEYVRFRDSRGRKFVSRRQMVSKQLESEEGRRALSIFGFLDEGDPLRQSVWQWGEKYHLNSAWCYDVALKSLQHWHKYKETVGKRFESLPFYGHPHYLGFSGLALTARLNPDSLSEEQRAFLTPLNEQQKALVNSLSERQIAFLSSYPQDPHVRNDERFLNQIESVVEGGLSLPVFNLLSSDEFNRLRRTLLESAQKLWKQIKETAKEISSVDPIEVGKDELDKHLEWAARYQVFDESYYSIEGHKLSDGYDKRRAYAKVRKGARHILELVDLKPRTRTSRTHHF